MRPQHTAPTSKAQACPSAGIEPEYLNMSDIARKLGCHRCSVTRARHLFTDVPAVQIGRVTHWHYKSVVAVLAALTVKDGEK